MSERVCKDCDGLLARAPRDEAAATAWDDELMCVICGAAMCMGGPLYGELAALAEEHAA